MLQVLLYTCSLAKFKGVVSRNSPNKPWTFWQFNSNAHLSQILSEKAATVCGWCLNSSSFRMIVLMDNHWYTKLLSCLSPFILKDFLDRWSWNHWTYNTPRTGGLSVLSFFYPLIFPFLVHSWAVWNYCGLVVLLSILISAGWNITKDVSFHWSAYMVY